MFFFFSFFFFFLGHFGSVDFWPYLPHLLQLSYTLTHRQLRPFLLLSFLVFILSFFLTCGSNFSLITTIISLSSPLKVRLFSNSSKMIPNPPPKVHPFSWIHSFKFATLPKLRFICLDLSQLIPTYFWGIHFLTSIGMRQYAEHTYWLSFPSIWIGYVEGHPMGTYQIFDQKQKRLIWPRMWLSYRSPTMSIPRMKNLS